MRDREARHETFTAAEKEQHRLQFLGNVTAARIDTQDHVEAVKWYRKGSVVGHPL